MTFEPARSAIRFCALHLQGRLVIDNLADGRLTRCFAIEYAALFDVLIPALASWQLPIPLGGTSTHFRTALLRRVHGWDAWNVTEDADLGIRLARAGYHVGDLPSDTLEEAPRAFRPWLHQRTRWMKGFLQTSLTHGRTCDVQVQMAHRVRAGFSGICREWADFDAPLQRVALPELALMAEMAAQVQMAHETGGSLQFPSRPEGQALARGRKWEIPRFGPAGLFGGLFLRVDNILTSMSRFGERGPRAEIWEIAWPVFNAGFRTANALEMRPARAR